MAEALHRADVESVLTDVDYGDSVSFNYRSDRSGCIRAKSGRVVDAYSPLPGASGIVVRDGESLYEVKPDGTVRSEQVGELGVLTRLTVR